jgi:hypothetical protein
LQIPALAGRLIWLLQVEVLSRLGVYPASHKAGRMKLCRPELARNAMLMSM